MLITHLGTQLREPALVEGHLFLRYKSIEMVSLGRQYGMTVCVLYERGRTGPGST